MITLSKRSKSASSRAARILGYPLVNVKTTFIGGLAPIELERATKGNSDLASGAGRRSKYLIALVRTLTN